MSDEKGFTTEQMNTVVAGRVSEVKAKLSEEFASKESDYQKKIAELTASHTTKETAFETEVTGYKTQLTEFEAKTKELAEKAAKADALAEQITIRDFEDTLVSKGIAPKRKKQARVLMASEGLLKTEEGKDLDIDAVIEKFKPEYPSFFVDSIADAKTTGTQLNGRQSTPAAKTVDPRQPQQLDWQGNPIT